MWEGENVMMEFCGKSVYKGIAMGNVLVLKNQDYQIKRIRIENTQEEIKRVQQAGEQAKEQLQKQQSRFEELSHSLYESEKNMEDYKNEMVEQIRINTEAKGDKSKRQSMLEQFEQRQKQILSESGNTTLSIKRIYE